MLKEIITKQLADRNCAKSLVYCVDIHLKSGKILHLTNSSKQFVLGSIIYLPNSGIEIEEIYFEDCGQNYIIISGIYEKNGIDIDTPLIDAKFSVNMFLGETLHNIAIYSCNEFSRGELDFVIKLESQIHKYNKRAALLFSKTCRATLGDKKCKVDLEKFVEYHVVSTIEGKKIYLEALGNEDLQAISRSGYFTGGRLVFQIDQDFEPLEKYLIISHNLNQITLSKYPSSESQSASVVKITPGCDKQFITCCKKFDNALNFRGEPFVPEFNKLKN